MLTKDYDNRHLTTDRNGVENYYTNNTQPAINAKNWYFFILILPPVEMIAASIIFLVSAVSKPFYFMHYHIIIAVEEKYRYHNLLLFKI